MKKVIFIIPYYGQLPDYFPAWLISAKAQKNIDFLLVTDLLKESPAQNIHILHNSFNETQKLFQSKFDFKISLNKPYKLCDYKPAYGYIFSKYLKGYDFWGHCDVDLIWGNIREYLTNDVLDNYDLLFRTGHFRLYRNIEKMNLFFKNSNLLYGYKQVFTHKESYCFDEMNSMQRELLFAGSRYYDNDNAEADIDPFHNGIKLREVSDIRKKYQVYRTTPNYDNQIFTWENGHIYRYYIDECLKLNRDEFCDIHFLKRKMNGNINQLLNHDFIITPNQFILIEKPISKDTVKKYSYDKVPIECYSNIVAKIKKFIQLNGREKIITLKKNWYSLLIKMNFK